MTGRIRLICAKTGDGLIVNPGGSINVNVVPERSIVFSEYLTATGIPSGSSQMAITTGTLAAPVRFYVKADTTYDLLITRLKFYVSGAAANLNEFGTGTALTNGCRLFYKDNDGNEIQINPLIKTNYDLVRLAGGSPAFGSGASAYQLLNSVGTAEAFHPVLNFTDFMPNGEGIFLKRNSKQQLGIEIRDNTLTSKAVDFNCIADGEKLL